MAYRYGGGAVVDRVGKDDWTAEHVAPSIIPDLSRRRRSPLPFQRTHARRGIPRCPEIDCVRHLLPRGAIAMAELRAAEIGIGAERALIAAGAIGEHAYVAALATELGVPFEPLHGRPREQIPIGDDRLIEAATTGLLPLLIGNDVKFVVAPTLVDCRRLIETMRSSPGLRSHIRLTSSARMRGYIAREAAPEIEHRTIAALQSIRPELSARNDRTRYGALATIAAACTLLALAAPGIAMAAAEVALGTIFLAWTGLRLFGLFSGGMVRRQPRAFADDKLPVYTIVVALYRESAAVKGLVAALRALRPRN